MWNCNLYCVALKLNVSFCVCMYVGSCRYVSIQRRKQAEHWQCSLTELERQPSQIENVHVVQNIWYEMLNKYCRLEVKLRHSQNEWEPVRNVLTYLAGRCDHTEAYKNKGKHVRAVSNVRFEYALLKQIGWKDSGRRQKIGFVYFEPRTSLMC
jgi:hypothetical protein